MPLGDWNTLLFHISFSARHLGLHARNLWASHNVSHTAALIKIGIYL